MRHTLELSNYARTDAALYSIASDGRDGDIETTFLCRAGYIGFARGFTATRRPRQEHTTRRINAGLASSVRITSFNIMSFVYIDG